MKLKTKVILITFGIIGVAFAAPQLIPNEHAYQVVNWEKPTTIQGWAEDVKAESFNRKHYYQLNQMEENLTMKLPFAQAELDELNECPECVRCKIREELKGEYPKKVDLKKEVDKQFAERSASIKWDVDKLNQSLERLAKEKDMRDKGEVDRTDEILGTTYYVDADCATPGDGTTATCNNDGTDSYDDLDDFTEVARSAGDKVIVRRTRTAQVGDGTDLIFTSDGSKTNPITIEADYANAWTDDVDLSGTGTATLTFGSKTITFSADISGVLAAHDWIYAASDDAKEFSYEVETVSTVTVTLYLPYKGAQAGSGKTMTNMGDAPIWGTVAGDFNVYVDETYWKIQGIHIRGTDTYGQVRPYNSRGSIFKDLILEGDSSTSYGMYSPDFNIKIYKTRSYNNDNGIKYANSEAYFYDCLFDGNSAGVTGLENSRRGYFYDCEFKNHTQADIEGRSNYGGHLYFRNCIFSSAKEIDLYSDGANEVYSEDHDGTLGDNRSNFRLSYADDSPITKSETTTVRAGGGSTSIKMTPTDGLSSNSEYSKVMMFEYPIYADTTSKTYTVYFKTNATADWTADPTNSELWIEAEYWGHASNNHRRILKSTGLVDFNGSTAWQSVTVTAQPSQTGILYLRGYYCKTKEASSNIFYIDVAPIIS